MRHTVVRGVDGSRGIRYASNTHRPDNPLSPTAATLPAAGRRVQRTDQIQHPTPQLGSQLLAQLDRLLAGTPLRSNGSLTVVALADEANVKRHLLTHRHTDLKDEFYARVRARGHVRDNERKLRDGLTKALERIKELAAENNKLHGENDALARLVNVFELENHELRTSTGRSGRLVVLPSVHDR